MPASSKKMTSGDAGSSTKKNKKRSEDPAGDGSWTVVTAASSSRDSPQQPQDPLQTAVLYESIKKKQQQQAGGCGHTVPLDRFVVRHKASCPVCDAPVYYVQDGGTSLTSRTVCFKYGKIVYRLSVPQKEDSQQNNKQQRPWWMFWGGDGGHDGDGNTKNSPRPFSSETAAATTTTAQGRIMSVLGMAHGGMKILCKGKVLYPLPSYTTEADREIQEQELSQKLIELSVVVVVGQQHIHSPAARGGHPLADATRLAGERGARTTAAATARAYDGTIQGPVDRGHDGDRPRRGAVGQIYRTLQLSLHGRRRVGLLGFGAPQAVWRRRPEQQHHQRAQRLMSFVRTLQTKMSLELIPNFVLVDCLRYTNWVFL